MISKIFKLNPRVMGIKNLSLIFETQDDSGFFLLNKTLEKVKGINYLIQIQQLILL